jgi:hypothetical protein
MNNSDSNNKNETTSKNDTDNETDNEINNEIDNESDNSLNTDLSSSILESDIEVHSVEDFIEQLIPSVENQVQNDQEQVFNNTEQNQFQTNSPNVHPPSFLQAVEGGQNPLDNLEVKIENESSNKINEGEINEGEINEPEINKSLEENNFENIFDLDSELEKPKKRGRKPKSQLIKF